MILRQLERNCKLNKKILIFAVIVGIGACNTSKHCQDPYAFQKVVNGVYPSECMIIVTEKDTLFSSSKDLKMYGSFQEKHTGQYFIGRNLEKTRFHCRIENGVLVGNYIHYYGYYKGDSTQILSQGYLSNGRWAGYQVYYHANGQINEINIYNPCGIYERGGTWTYFDENGDLLKMENYGEIPDTCHIPNQYLFDSLPEKYKYHYDTLQKRLQKVLQTRLQSKDVYN